MSKIKIKVLSKAESVAGQGVGSAAYEQKKIVKEDLPQFHLFQKFFGKAEIVHIHSINPTFYLKLLFHRKKKSRYVGYVHFLPETLEGSIKLPWLIKKMFYRYVVSFYKHLDQAIVVNPQFVDKLANLKVKKDKISYIPNVVNTSEFRRLSAPEIADLKQTYNVNPDQFVVFGVGQLQTRKGVREFIEIARVMPDVLFIWAGGFSFGKITDGYKEIEKAVKEAPANCRFLGIVDRSKMNELYNISDLFFLPSYAELFPMCILESMNVGVPLLLRDVDLYEPILFDFYARGNSNAEFINIIRQLKDDKAFYQHYCDKSKEGAQYYRRDNIAKLWKEFYFAEYQKLINKNRGKKKRKMQEKLENIKNENN